MTSKSMKAHRTTVSKALQADQPKTFKKPDPPLRAPRMSSVEKRLRTLENRVGND